MKLALIGLALFFLCSCNKNSNELPAFTGTDSTFKKAVTLSNNLSDIVSATFYRYKSSSHDSVCVIFTNISPGTLSNLRVAVEVSSSSPATYDNSKVYLDTTLTLSLGNSSNKLVIAADQNLPFTPANYNIYVLRDDSLQGPGLGGIYENKFSLFRDSAKITEFPQLYGFIQVDGSALFRIKISDSIEYTIPNGKFESLQHFAGYLMTMGQIVSYLSTDSTVQAQATNKEATFGFKLLKSLPDSTNNIFINAYRY